MSDKKHNIFFGQFAINNEGYLVPSTKSDTVKLEAFKQGLGAGQIVDVFMEADEDNGTLPQLAKIHACIRELAKTTGYTFEDMKLEIKRQAGLCVRKELGGEVFMVCKSFGRCSKEELALAIEAILQAGDTVGINFH